MFERATTFQSRIRNCCGGIEPRQAQTRRRCPDPGRAAELVAARSTGLGSRRRVPAPAKERERGRGHCRWRLHRPVDGLLPELGDSEPRSRDPGTRHLWRRAERTQRWLCERLVGRARQSRCALRTKECGARLPRNLAEHHIADFCNSNGVDAWYGKAGYVYAATAPQHLDLCRRMVQAAHEVGAPDEMRPLSESDVRARCDSAAFKGGAFMRDGASVQPARLARGLRRVLLER